MGGRSSLHRARAYRQRLANTRPPGPASAVHLPDRLLTFSSALDLEGDAESLRYRFRRDGH
ncbi:MAG TPA: hypothetical protein VFW16_01645 [Streptosporangiaceae bacterium]|nr:hypothetical protein [Streptosporangiaceae bacterium]